MSRLPHEAASLGLSTTQVALLWRDRDTRSPRWSTVNRRCAGGNDAQALGDDIAVAVADCPEDMPVRVTLASDLVRWWSVTAPAGTAGMAELRDVAALRFEELFGEPADSWTLQADWDASRPFVCTAVPSAVPAAVAASLAKRTRGAIDIVPAATRLIHRAGPPPLNASPAWVLASVVGSSATLWWHRRRRAVQARSLKVNSRNPWATVHDALRLAESQQGEPACEVHWLATEETQAPTWNDRHAREIKLSERAPLTADTPARLTAWLGGHA